jgi:hypothetical protein
MNITQLEQWASEHGFQKDKWGHWQKKNEVNEYRLKLSNISVRYEVKVHHAGTEYSKPDSEWVRIQSGYLKNILITPEGKLAGLKR